MESRPEDHKTETEREKIEPEPYEQPKLTVYGKVETQTLQAVSPV